MPYKLPPDPVFVRSQVGAELGGLQSALLTAGHRVNLLRGDLAERGLAYDAVEKEVEGILAAVDVVRRDLRSKLGAASGSRVTVRFLAATAWGSKGEVRTLDRGEAEELCYGGLAELWNKRDVPPGWRVPIVNRT